MEIRRLELMVGLVTLAACGSDAAPLDVAGGGTPVVEPPALAGHLFAPPVANPAAISSTFGPRWKASANRQDFHPGVDYVDQRGTPVLAIGDGVVEDVYPDGSSTYPAGGNVVIVRHVIPPTTFHGIEVDRVFAVYLHLDAFSVAAGEPVVAGQTIGAMGMTGDTEFVHLHFETRVQTLCSLPYQIEHPDSSCALGFDPHVHPFLFVGGDNTDRIELAALPEPHTYRYAATRGDLDLDVIETEQGTIGFSERAGLDATSLTTLDNFDRGWLRIVPEPFTSTSERIAYEVHFERAPRYIELRDIHGAGVRFGAP